MQIKNKINLILLSLLSLILMNFKLCADEFNISASEISVDKENNIISGVGSVEATDSDGNIIYSDKVVYKQSQEFLIAEGSVKIIDKTGNILITEKATYDKKNEIIKI